MIKVQVNNGGRKELSFSQEEQNQIQADLKGQFAFDWLPEVGRSRQDFQFSAETALVIFSGITIGSLVTAFVESAVKEAGKEFWNGYKSLVSKIWKKQATAAYRFKGRANIVFEGKSDYIAIEFASPRTSQGEVSQELLERAFEDTLARLEARLELIDQKIKELRASPTDPQASLRIHWIKIPGERFYVATVPSWTYIGASDDVIQSEV